MIDPMPPLLFPPVLWVRGWLVHVPKPDEQPEAQPQPSQPEEPDEPDLNLQLHGDGSDEGRGVGDGKGENEGDEKEGEGEPEESDEGKDGDEEGEGEGDEGEKNERPGGQGYAWDATEATGHPPPGDQIQNETSARLFHAQGVELDPTGKPEAPDVHERAQELENDPRWPHLRDLTRGQAGLVAEVSGPISEWLAGARKGDVLGAALERVSQLRSDMSMLAPGLEKCPPADGVAKDARIELATRLCRQPAIRRLLDLAGRIASQAWTKRMAPTPSVSGSIVDLERGNDLTRTIIEQLAVLGDADLELLFLKDYAEDALVQFRMEGREPVKRGSIVMLIDESGSMEDPTRLPGFSRNDVASALAIGCARIAHSQKRDVYLCGFNAQPTWTRTLKRRASPLLAADLTAHLVTRRPNGGTQLDRPMDWALSILKRDRGSDLVVITDGEADMENSTAHKLKREREQRGFGIFTLTMGTQVLDPLRSLSDAVIEVSDEAGLREFASKFVHRDVQ